MNRRKRGRYTADDKRNEFDGMKEERGRKRGEREERGEERDQIRSGQEERESLGAKEREARPELPTGPECSEKRIYQN